ncbi:unnamed protein product [Protopolystoma xenopodis]|uniref:Uncharacterized protein n=1 Tax=Protopolystoma xenopodis TaxID=117903 RepID=A0A3S5BQY0_9PLAT|nr:unnamed protein product [Protopolystoma xenopodis]
MKIESFANVLLSNPDAYDPSLLEQGKKINVRVIGLHANGSLVARPGDQVELRCEAVDTLTNRVLLPEEVSFAWSLFDSRGVAFPFDKLAQQTILSGGHTLRLTYLRPTDQLPIESRPHGRCSAFHYDLTYLYFSPVFPIQVVWLSDQEIAPAVPLPEQPSWDIQDSDKWCKLGPNIPKSSCVIGLNMPGQLLHKLIYTMLTEENIIMLKR